MCTIEYGFWAYFRTLKCIFLESAILSTVFLEFPYSGVHILRTVVASKMNIKFIEQLCQSMSEHSFQTVVKSKDINVLYL